MPIDKSCGSPVKARSIGIGAMRNDMPMIPVMVAPTANAVQPA